MCDGEEQCYDGSDEAPKYCSDEASGSGSDSCPDDYAECATENECVLVSSLCNGIFDCTDESDEDDEFCEIWGYTESPEKRDEASGSGSDSCPDDYAECATGNECVLESVLCNGYLDCTDGSDEDDEFCEEYGYQKKRADKDAVLKRLLSKLAKEKKQVTDVVCDDGYVPCDSMDMCTKIEEMCDGEEQCYDGSDEAPKYCSDEASGSGSDSCPDDYAECATENECVLVSSLCNGIFDCTDESDEDDEFCEIWGYTESPEKRDEASGSGSDSCPDDYAECATGNECVLESVLCNGYLDCTDGSDEDDEFCEEYGYQKKRADKDAVLKRLLSKLAKEKKQVTDTISIEITDEEETITTVFEDYKPSKKRQDEDGCVTDTETVYDEETDTEITYFNMTCTYDPTVKRGLSSFLASRQETAGLCDCAESTDLLNPGQTTYTVAETCLCPVKVKKHASLKRQNRTAVKKIGKIQAGLKRNNAKRTFGK